jgi:hypothetical protein
MRFRLEHWRRIGIAISVVWILGGGFWGYELGARWNESAREDAASKFYQCLNAESLGSRSEACEEREREMDRIRAYQWPTAALLGLGPIPLGWLLAYLAVGIVRRSRTGHSRQKGT